MLRDVIQLKYSVRSTFHKCLVHAEEAYDSISVKDHRNDEWKGQFSERSHTTTRDPDNIVKEKEESRFDHFRAKEREIG